MAAWGMASSGTLTWVAGLALLTVLVINLIWKCERPAKKVPVIRWKTMQQRLCGGPG